MEIFIPRFLSKRIIVCEGSTEVGFIRSLDKFLYKKHKFRMAHKGITTADGNGETTFKCAKILLTCGYDICILMDSDKNTEDKKKEDFRSLGVDIFDWAAPNALEEQVFYDLPNDAAIKLLNVAKEKANSASICDKLKNEGIICSVDADDNISFSAIPAEEQQKIGKVA